jgi:hypothetical protein
MIEVPARDGDIFVAPALRPGLAPARWDGALRIDDALAPGLVAEVLVALANLPFELYIDDARADVRWRCTLTLPPKLDPQLPGPGWRLVRLLARELPALASAVVGRAVTVAEPHTLPLISVRKGSYLDDTPAPELEAVIGLAGAPWPAAWGGHTELPERGVVWPPGCGTIDLLDAGVRRRIPLVRRHVEALALHVPLVAA